MERIDILGFSSDELSIEKLEELISSKKSPDFVAGSPKAF